MAAPSGPVYTIPGTLDIAGYEARDATVDANGDIVTIPDKLAVNTITSVGGLAARADLIADAGVGGELVAVFGANASHRIQVTSWAGGAVSQPHTRVIVCRFDAEATHVALAGGAANTPSFYYDATATSHRVNAGAAMGAGIARTGAWEFWLVVFNGASTAIYRNDVTTPVTTVSAGTATLNGTTLGANMNGSAALNGRIFGAYDCSGALNLAQRQAWAQYITQETGLAITV